MKQLSLFVTVIFFVIACNNPTSVQNDIGNSTITNDPCILGHWSNNFNDSLVFDANQVAGYSGVGTYQASLGQVVIDWGGGSYQNGFYTITSDKSTLRISWLSPQEIKKVYRKKTK